MRAVNYLRVLYLSLTILLSGLIYINGYAQTDLAYHSEKKSDLRGGKVKITVGNSTFTATLFDNTAANTFLAQLPVTMNMSDIKGNEKRAELPGRLAINVTNSGTHRPGDLMLYGSNTLVLFYKTCSTDYNYTELGHIDDAAGLAKALGSGDVVITFELAGI